MDRIEASYEQSIQRFVEWSKDCDDVRGLVIVGSRARVDHPADGWSDLDVIVITTDPDHYLLKTN
jgi:aminoglycoside 6-adenylyltransferase